MNMITEDYVSFEVAKLLKEKGFDEPVLYYFRYGHCEPTYPVEGILSKNSDLFDAYSIPTLQMTMKWLRKKHNLHCDIDYNFRLGWCIQITSLKEVVQDHYTEMKTYLPHKAVSYPSYEEAAEAAIKYCLENLI